MTTDREIIYDATVLACEMIIGGEKHSNAVAVALDYILERVPPSEHLTIDMLDYRLRTSISAMLSWYHLAVDQFGYVKPSAIVDIVVKRR